MAFITGSRIHSRSTMSRFLPESDTFLSATFPSADLNFCILRVLQSDKFKLPFCTFNTHSLIQFTSYLALLVISALRNFGSAVLVT